MENILDIIVQIVSIALGGAVIYAVTIVCPQITEWFLAKIATIKNDALRKAVELLNCLRMSTHTLMTRLKILVALYIPKGVLVIETGLFLDEPATGDFLT